MATIRRREEHEAGVIGALLTESSLPEAGFREQFERFLIAEVQGVVAGVAGLERYDRYGLLRSVAVRPAYRGTGLAERLVLSLLEDACAAGVERIFLLTETAERFFFRFGFEPQPRSVAPQQLLAAPEFQGACPASAVLMNLNLKHPPALVRRAQEADIPAITIIYNQGIEDRTATLETELRPEEERRRWLADRGELHPVVVAVRRGQVVAWASLNPFNARAAYRFVADFSVYVERTQRGTGLGSLLLRDLERRAAALGYHKLVLTTFPSSSGVHLYNKLGFRQIGIYREQGMLDGRWMDTLVMEKLLEK